MLPFLTVLFVACLFCVGLHTLTRPNSIFGFWSSVVCSDDGRQRFAMASPLSECLVCMSSLYGSLIFGMYFGFSGEASVLFPFLLFLIFVSVVSEIKTGNKEIAKASEYIYIISITFFCATQYQERFFESIVFLICLSGLNAVVDRLFSAIESDQEANQNQIENSIDQAAALEEILRTINKK
jgi:hypothetical protein